MAEHNNFWDEAITVTDRSYRAQVSEKSRKRNSFKRIYQCMVIISEKGA